MTISLKEILQLNNSLKSIIQNTESDINPSLKFKLLGIMKNIEIPVTNFETIRNEKICKYGKDDGTGKFTIPNDDKEAINNFMNDIEEIINSNTEVYITKIKSKDVFNKGLSAEHLLELYPIIEE